MIKIILCKIETGRSLLHHASAGKISELLKMLTGVIFSLHCKLEIYNSLYSDGLTEYVWLGETTRKEESHKLSKEAKAGICYLNPPNETNNYFKNKQGGQ